MELVLIKVSNKLLRKGKKMKHFNIFKVLIVLITLSLSASVLASDNNCRGTYDMYDDTCYMDNGEYTHYNYDNGRRLIHGNNGSFTLHDWRGGSHIGSHSGRHYNTHQSYRYSRNVDHRYGHQNRGQWKI